MNNLLIPILVITTIIFLLLVVIFLTLYRDRFGKFFHSKSNSNKLLDQRVDSLIEQIIEAVSFFQKHKIGCFIVFCGSNKLNNFTTNEGVQMNSDLSADLIECIFGYKKIQLHDGALLIDEKWKIRACSVFFRVKKIVSVSQRAGFKKYGTRHLVASQIAQDNDIVTLVVSEKNGEISFIDGSQTSYLNIDLDDLRTKLREKYE